MESGACSRSLASKLANPKLETVEYTDFINRLAENLFLKFFIAFFDKPLVATKRIISGIFNQSVL